MTNKFRINGFSSISPDNIIKFIILPCVLLLLWLCLSLFYNPNNSFTTLQYPHYADSKNNFDNKKLLKGQKLTGVFRAEDNNLGIISVKFGDIRKVEYEQEDSFIFRIREVGQSSWIYEREYRSGLAVKNEYLPFGFDTIAKSKNKMYEFELESLNGTNVNALVTDGANPVYLTKYKFSKAEVLGDYRHFAEFTVKKIRALMRNYDLLLSSSVYILPFVFYIALLFLGSRNIKYRKATMFVAVNYLPLIYSSGTTGKTVNTGGLLRIFLIIIVMFAYVIFSGSPVTGILLGLVGLWVIAVYVNALNSMLTYILSCIFITISVARLTGSPSAYVDNSSSLAYFLLLTGAVQDIINIKRSRGIVK